MLAEGIAQRLDALGLADYRPDTDGGDTFLGRTPLNRDAVLVLTDTAGAQRGMPEGLLRPSFQAMARGGPFDYDGPRDRLADVITALDGLDHVSLPNGLVLVSCDAEQTSAEPLGMDRNNRWRFVANFRCHRVQP